MKRIVDFLMGFFDFKHSIRAKIFVYFTIAIGTITSVISLYWYQVSVRSTTQALMENMARSVSASQTQVDNLYDDIRKMHATLVNEASSSAYILRSDYNSPDAEWFSYYNHALGNLRIMHTNLSRIVAGVGIFKRSGQTCVSGILSLEGSIFERAEVQPLLRTPGADLLFFVDRPGKPDENGVSRYFFVGRSIVSNGITQAVMLTRVDTASIVGALEASAYPGGFILLADEQGEVLYDSRPAGEAAQRESYGAYLGPGARPDGFVRTKEYMLVMESSKSTGLTVLSAIPLSYIGSLTQRVSLQLVVMLLAALLAVAGVSMVVCDKMLSGLRCLARDMKRAGDGSMEGLRPLETEDEVGHLSASFVEMIGRIQHLLENVRLSERQQREMEIKVLRAQISPHFLYNSLNTISFLARLQNADNIQQLTASLIDLLQGAVEVDDRLIPVNDEIHYVRSYINIQQYRYPCGVRVDYQVEGDAGRCRVPKMILQPIVENALIHGLADARADSALRIRAWRDGSLLFFSVTDNGVGMTQEKIEQVLSGRDNRSRMRFSGIGVGNVDARIKLQMGEGFGASIYSQPGLFTTVELKLPALEDSPAAALPPGKENGV